MSEDIVAIARYRAQGGIPDFTNSALLEALAEEIERLRGELRSVHAHLARMRQETEGLRAIHNDHVVNRTQ